MKGRTLVRTLLEIWDYSSLDAILEQQFQSVESRFILPLLIYAFLTSLVLALLVGGTGDVLNTAHVRVAAITAAGFPCGSDKIIFA